VPTQPVSARRIGKQPPWVELNLDGHGDVALFGGRFEGGAYGPSHFRIETREAQALFLQRNSLEILIDGHSDVLGSHIIMVGSLKSASRKRRSLRPKGLGYRLWMTSLFGESRFQGKTASGPEGMSYRLRRVLFARELR
jgi:hypothetical protein